MCAFAPAENDPRNPTAMDALFPRWSSAAPAKTLQMFGQFARKPQQNTHSNPRAQNPGFTHELKQ